MGDIVTFGVGVAVAAVCLVTAAIFQWAPYFSSRWDWTDYTVLPLYLSGVAGLMTATIAGVSVSNLLNEGTSTLQGALNRLVPALATIIIVGLAVWVAFNGIGYILKGDHEKKKPAIYVGLMPLTLALIPAPLGPILVAIVGIPVVLATFVVKALTGM